MTHKVDISHISKFDGTYFNIWQQRLTLVFKAEKLWSVVSGSEPLPIAPNTAQIAASTPVLPTIGAGSISHWEERDTLSLTIIINCLENNVISHIQSYKTSNEAWKELKNVFESQDAITKMYLKDKLHTLKMKENESVTKHIHVFRSHLEQLSTTRCLTQDDEAILSLMRSLLPSYRSFISSLRRQLGITLQSLITDLIQEETLMKDMNLNMDNTSALYVGKKQFYNNKKQNYNKNYKKFPNSKDESSFRPFEKKKNYSTDKKCFYCKKFGHFIQNCRTRIVAKKRKQSNMVIKPNILYMAALITNETSTWYVDSGATQHMCHESEASTNCTKYENQQFVYLGDDTTSYKIEGLGDVTIRLSNGIEKIIPKVLYIPVLAKNLFSAKQLDRVGGEISIKSGISISLNKSRQTIAKFKLNLDLYKLDTTIIPNKKILATPATTQNLNKADLWHLKIGHINQYRLKQIQSMSKGIDTLMYII